MHQMRIAIPVVLCDDLEPTRKELVALLAYAEDEAGGLMNTRYGRLRPEMSVDEAITYLRKQTPDRVESIYYAYVLDQQSKLLGVVSFRQLIMARGSAKVAEVMTAPWAGRITEFTNGSAGSR